MSEKMNVLEALVQSKADIRAEKVRIETDLWSLVEADLSPEGLHKRLLAVREDLHKNNYQYAIIQQIEILTGQTFSSPDSSAKELTLAKMKAEGASVPDPPPTYEKGDT
jgi:hypothetical protein